MGKFNYRHFLLFLGALTAPLHSIYAADFPGTAPSASGHGIVPVSFGGGGPATVTAVSFGGASAGAPKLSAEKFPKGFQDLSFVEKNQILEEGYYPWESEYDPVTGICVANCAYPGITIEKEYEMLERNTREAEAAALKYKQFEEEKKKEEEEEATGGPDEEDFWEPNYFEIKRKPTANICAPNHPGILTNQHIPYGYPFIVNRYISSGYQKDRLNPDGKYTTHYALDFPAVIGTPVFSTMSGFVVLAEFSGLCGGSVKIRNDRGYATLYCHLDKIMVKKGDFVNSGCMIGLSGNTGRSRGAHLHYAIHFNNKPINPIKPMNYLEP